MVVRLEGGEARYFRSPPTFGGGGNQLMETQRGAINLYIESHGGTPVSNELFFDYDGQTYVIPVGNKYQQRHYFLRDDLVTLEVWNDKITKR